MSNDIQLPWCPTPWCALRHHRPEEPCRGGGEPMWVKNQRDRIAQLEAERDRLREALWDIADTACRLAET